MNTNPARKSIRKPAFLFLLGVSVFLAVMSWFVAKDITKRVEENTSTVVEHAIPIKDMGWVSAKVDGMTVNLSGNAPDQTARIRVTEAMTKKINISRINNEIVAPDVSFEEPEVRVEIVQNAKMSSIIGLLPREPSPAPLYRALDRANPLLTTLNMIEDTTADAGESWAEQIDFLGQIIDTIPNVKISATPGTVKIDAVAQTDEMATDLRRKLTEISPNNINLQLNISSPRALIAPFEFSLLKENKKIELEQCAATDRDDLVAMRSAFKGLDGTAIDTCKLGLGAPTEKWGELVATMLSKLDGQERFGLRIRDNQILVQLSDQISEDERATIMADVRSSLPAGFGSSEEILITKRSIEELKADGQSAKLTLTKTVEGNLAVEGVFASPSAIENLKGFAVAKFGTENVDLNVEIVEGLPVSWEKNAFALLQVIAAMENGDAILTENQILIEGFTENSEVRDGLEKLLKSETSDVQISQNIEIDPQLAARAPDATPARCLERTNVLLQENPIQFEKSSTKIADGSLSNISRLGQILSECNEFSFEIGGHTDSQGGDDLNLSISESRANSVLDAILKLELDFGEISSRGYGSHEPIASNDTPGGRAKNRRIEVRILSGAGGQ